MSKETEAKNATTITVQWKDIKFDVPANRDDWPVETLIALEDGKTASIVRGFMPTATWREFMALDPTGHDLSEVTDEIAKALGLGGAGE